MARARARDSWSHSILASASFLLALVLTGRAGAEPLEAKYPLDRVIGSGQFKQVYSIKGREDVVVAISHGPAGQTALNKEIAALRTLAEHGVPAVNILESGTIGSGPHAGQSAIVMPRYAVGSKSSTTRVAPYFNQRSVDDYGRIMHALGKAKLHVVDFQVLLGKDGSMVVADPLAVTAGKPMSYIPLVSELVRQTKGRSDVYYYGQWMTADQANRARERDREKSNQNFKRSLGKPGLGSRLRDAVTRFLYP